MKRTTEDTGIFASTTTSITAGDSLADAKAVWAEAAAGWAAAPSSVEELLAKAERDAASIPALPWKDVVLQQRLEREAGKLRSLANLVRVLLAKGDTQAAVFHAIHLGSDWLKLIVRTHEPNAMKGRKTIERAAGARARKTSETQSLYAEINRRVDSRIKHGSKRSLTAICVDVGKELKVSYDTVNRARRAAGKTRKK